MTAGLDLDGDGVFSSKTEDGRHWFYDLPPSTYDVKWSSRRDRADILGAPAPFGPRA